MLHQTVAGDRPFLLSGADDRLAKVWDYQTKACVQTLEGHAHNVSAVMFHPELPVILTGCDSWLERRSVLEAMNARWRKEDTTIWYRFARPNQLADHCIQCGEPPSRHAELAQAFAQP